MEHGHQAAPIALSHPLRCRKHVVICASHADQQRRGIERGIRTAARHHHHSWRWVISRTQRQKSAHRRSDESGHSCNLKNRVKVQGREKQHRPALDDQVLASIARPTLQGAQQHQTWEASLLDTFLLPTSSHTAISMKQAGRAYQQEVQSASAGRRAELGPPHAHIYRAVVVPLVTQMQAMSPAPELITLSQQVQWITCTSLQQMEAAITVAKVSRTTRLQFRVLGEAIRLALRAALCTTGARHTVGTAPPNHHEQILAPHLSGAQDMEA